MSAAESSQQQSHLVSLVLQSKKALQHGEQLCSKAHEESSASAQASIEILALDAKVRWLSEAIVEQLKVRRHRLSTVFTPISPSGVFRWLQALQSALKTNALSYEDMFR